MTELNALAGPVNPGEVNHKGCLNRAPNPRRRVAIVILIGTANNPIENVQKAICTECNKVERVDDSRHGGLTEEQELRDNADGFEDFGKDP